MITPTQSLVLSSIHKAITETGFAPTYSELCVSAGVKSRGRLFEIILALEQRGYVRRLNRRRRALEIIKLPPSFGRACPTCGHVRETEAAA